MKNCSDCKNGKTKYSDICWNKKELDGFVMTDIKQPSGELYVKCELGHNDTIKNWWENNGHKTDRNTSDEVACFEPTEFCVFMDDLIGKLDEISKQLNK